MSSGLKKTEVDNFVVFAKSILECHHDLSLSWLFHLPPFVMRFHTAFVIVNSWMTNSEIM